MLHALDLGGVCPVATCSAGVGHECKGLSGGVHFGRRHARLLRGTPAERQGEPTNVLIEIDEAHVARATARQIYERDAKREEAL